jgi:hypothetical protein
MEWRNITHRPLSLPEANAKLRKEEGVAISKGSNDGRTIQTSYVRVASLSPVEDDFSYGSIDVGQGKQWQYWGVYDGHS